jgi:hypothetical protein
VCEGGREGGKEGRREGGRHIYRKKEIVRERVCEKNGGRETGRSISRLSVKEFREQEIWHKDINYTSNKHIREAEWTYVCAYFFIEKK